MANLNAKRFCDVCSTNDYLDLRFGYDLQIVKLGRLQLHPAEAQWLCDNDWYILTSASVYKVVRNGNEYDRKQVYHKTGAQFCKRGRFHVGDAKFIKEITGITINN